MADLSKIPTAELVKDLGDSAYDIYVAVQAMQESGADVLLKDGSQVAQRAGHNLHFVNRICKELLRREYKPEPT
jgi:hypothetical protein